MPTKDLWFLPDGGPGRGYVLDYDRIEHPMAGIAVMCRMFRKYAAGEVSKEPLHEVVLAFSTLVLGQLTRTYGINAQEAEKFLITTAERAAACLDMRLPPPIEAPVPRGLVLWLSVGDFKSERTLTHTLVSALG